MFEGILALRWVPPGRGLWAMGAMTDQGLYAALNNCGFVSTAGLAGDPARPFAFLMDAAMLGVGVGFDTKGAGEVEVVLPEGPPRTHVVADSREGWVESVRDLIGCFLPPLVGAGAAESRRPIVFDYSKVRPAGQPIRGFGGVASGPAPLEHLHGRIVAVLERNAGSRLTVTSIVDLMNHIGKCVVSGNVRQTAEIAFGDPDSAEYVDLKNYAVNPHRAEYGWTSNNSVLARVGMDYSGVVERIRINGEPGLAWLDNMRAYSRMGRAPDHKDRLALGGNPCLEQTLESYELCCLVETFPARHSDAQDYARTLRSAFLYAKTVTLGSTSWPETNAVMARNRRIGASMSGIAQMVASRGIETLREFCETGYQAIQGYDAEYSERFRVPRSIKTTSVKPSGTVSLLAGATPGIHFPESRFYVRRMRIGASSDLVAPLRAAGYPVEPAVNEKNTLVVEFPVDAGEGVRVLDDVSMWEQLALAAFMQTHWADNQVSATITFDPNTEGPHLKAALDLYQYQLKGVSFLPRLPAGAYPQMPYEKISEEEYRKRLANLKPLNLASTPRTSEAPSEAPEKFCDTDKCVL